jgi:hypothetical protein
MPKHVSFQQDTVHSLCHQPTICDTFQFGTETHMDLAAIFSDDQIAVIGCFVALTTCALVAAVSFQLGPAGKASAPGTERLKMAVARKHNDESEQKKAA